VLETDRIGEKMKTLLVEQPSYATLITRKASGQKIVESVIFVLLVIFMVGFIGYSSPYFNYGVFGSAILVLLLSPFVYKALVQPKYTLTETELIIEKKRNQIIIPLAKIEDAYDLRYIFQINGKKELLNVSDVFLNELNQQRLRLKSKK